MERDSGRPNSVQGQPTAVPRELPSFHEVPRAVIAVLFLYLIFEYLRIHEMWPILERLNIQTMVFAVLLLIVIVQTGKGGVRLTRQSWLLLGFFVLAVFTILPAINQFRAYQFAYGLALALIGFFAITHILQNERDVRRFLAFLVVIHIYIAVKGVLGYAGREFDEHGYVSTGKVGGYILGDENDLALAMIVVLPFGIYLYRQAHSLPGRIFWGSGTVAILLAIIFTFSRGGFIGLTAMLLYWVVTSPNRGKAIGGVVLVAALVIAVAPSEYWARIETIKDTDSGTAQLRRNSWAAARRMFRDSPIWGVGGYNFGVLVPDYAIDFSPERRPTQWGRATHSMYFQLLAEFGLLGVWLIGWVLLLNFRNLAQVISLSLEGRCSVSMGQLANSLRVSMVGFVVSATFLSVLQYPHLYNLTGLTVVVARLAFAEHADSAIEPAGVHAEA